MVVVAIVAVFMLGILNPPVKADTYTMNPHWKKKWERFNAVTAGATFIPVGAPLAYDRASGRVDLADASNRNRTPCIGFAGTESSAAGTNIEVITRGILSGISCGLGTENLSAITPIGVPLFLAGTGGVYNRDATGVTLFSGVSDAGNSIYPSGTTQTVGWAMHLSDRAVTTGVTIGTDTYYIDVQMPVPGKHSYYSH